MRGPFVFEHAPVKAEGCMACHTPHGSQNPRLLNMPNVNVLCNQCHSAVAAGTVHGQGQGSSDSVAVHELPHLHSWLEHESGIPQVIELGLRCPRTPSDGAAGIPQQLAHEFKISMSATMFFSSEASYDEHGWFSRLLQSTALFRK